METWLEDIAGRGFASAALWTLLALVLLAVILVIIRLVRSLTFGTFVVGGRNRKTRLAVMDATPVDSHRRLVLVRRDDVEHLILIGGPTDVVVEQHIRAGVPQPQRRPGPPEGSPEPVRQPQHAPAQQAARQAAPQPAQRPHAPEPQRRPAPAPAPAASPALQQVRAVVTPLPPRPADPRAAPPRIPSAAIATTPPPSSAPKRLPDDDLDNAMLSELEVSLEAKPPMVKKKPELSLEDEMNKLLGELTASGKKK